MIISTRDFVRHLLAFQLTFIRFHIEQLPCLIKTWDDNPMPLNVHNFSYVKLYLSDLDMPLSAHENTQSCSHVQIHTENTHSPLQSCQGLAGRLFFLVRISQARNNFFQLHLQSSLFKNALHPNSTLIWPTEA